MLKSSFLHSVEIGTDSQNSQEMARHTALKLIKYPMCNRVVPCCKNTILSNFIQFQHYGEKDTLAYREMKLLLPGGSGAGGM